MHLKEQRLTQFLINLDNLSVIGFTYLHLSLDQIEVYYKTAIRVWYTPGYIGYGYYKEGQRTGWVAFLESDVTDDKISELFLYAPKVKNISLREAYRMFLIHQLSTPEVSATHNIDYI